METLFELQRQHLLRISVDLHRQMSALRLLRDEARRAEATQDAEEAARAIILPFFAELRV